MQYLRSVLFLLFLLLYTPLFACLCLLSFLFLNTQGRYTMIRGWAWPIIRLADKLCGIRYHFKGWEHCTALMNQPVIVLSKHQSAWETIAFVAFFPKRLCYVFKRELLLVPFFGWILGLLRMVHINRSAGTRAFQSVVEQGKQRLSEGAWIIMFPEGTRTASGTQGYYKTGGARLAVTTQAFVIPIAHNAGRCWPRKSMLKYPGTIAVSIGPPISSQNKTPEQLNHEVQTWIEQEMRIIDSESYQPRTHANKNTQQVNDAQS